MSYLINHNTGEIWGDEHSQQQAKKALGLAYKDDNGRYVSQNEIDESDRAGE